MCVFSGRMDRTVALKVYSLRGASAHVLQAARHASPPALNPLPLQQRTALLKHGCSSAQSYLQ